ncbi:MAG: hypothetical protein HYR76_13745 [Ignavibacteria bacterium]|nr:hypothetical protein [Ignavibacteria bacterium]
MTTLHVALQEGFSSDTVVVRIQSREVLRKANVNTRLQTGYADSVETEVHVGSVNVEVILPSRNISKKIRLQISVPTYLGVSVVKGIIESTVSQTPFGYV